MMSILDDTYKLGTGFLQQYHNNGFEIISSVPVSSRIDPSVFLVGSTISVLKHYLLSDARVPHCVMLQPAIRTQCLVQMERGCEMHSIYGSFFLAMGTLAPYESLQDTSEIACSYLCKFLPPGRQGILLRVSSADKDLLEVCKHIGATEVDSQLPIYYRHRYGLAERGIFGRNFNIAIPTLSGFLDVGNIIVIERNGIPFAVEFAMGMSTLLTHLKQLPHTMLGNIVADVLPMGSSKEYQLGDCLSVVNCLRQEGVLPRSSKMQGRILKRYQRVMDVLCQELGKDPDTLLTTYSIYAQGLLPLLRVGNGQ